jgi:hypothetical protein
MRDLGRQKLNKSGVNEDSRRDRLEDTLGKQPRRGRWRVRRANCNPDHNPKRRGNPIYASINHTLQFGGKVSKDDGRTESDSFKELMEAKGDQESDKLTSRGDSQCEPDDDRVDC